MALDGFAKDYFTAGTNLGGFVEYPNAINTEAFNRFREDWQKTYSGVLNAHRVAILEGGFKFTKFDADPEKAQALESRKMQIEEVCRIFGIPPHKAFLLDRTTFSNIENMNIEYVQECINPMAERLEQTIYKDLLNSKEQKTLAVNFSVNKLLKGDTATRTSYYAVMRQNGIMSANEIRDLEEFNKLPAESGADELFLNGNMLPLTAAMLNLPKSAQATGNTQQNKV
jgi:HK97 family phage portal protein